MKIVWKFDTSSKTVYSKEQIMHMWPKYLDMQRTVDPFYTKLREARSTFLKDVFESILDKNTNMWIEPKNGYMQIAEDWPSWIGYVAISLCVHVYMGVVRVFLYVSPTHDSSSRWVFVDETNQKHYCLHYFNGEFLLLRKDEQDVASIYTDSTI